MGFAARVDLGVIDEARQRHRRRRSVAVLAAVAVLAGAAGFEAGGRGGLFSGSHAGAFRRQSTGAAPARASLGACGPLGGLLDPGNAGPRYVVPICVRPRGRPAGALPRNIVIEPAGSIARTPVRSR